MPRCNPRCSLGVSALVALAVAGCGAAGNQQKLHLTAEKRLLSLVARARVDASRHNGRAVHAALTEFISEVDTLRSSGQLGHGTAGSLDREARATADAAVRRLHRASTTARHAAAPHRAGHDSKQSGSNSAQGDQGGDGGD